MGKRLEIKEGEVFGWLSYIKEDLPRYHKSGQISRIVICQCKCGNIKSYTLSRLLNGHTKSCGCYHNKVTSPLNGLVNKTHGDRRNSNHTYIYNTWRGIKKRCLNPNHKSYKHYGGRSITIYEPWINNYILFKEWILGHLGERPDNYSLDRINNDGNYRPGNLRWADDVTQNNNRR